MHKKTQGLNLHPFFLFFSLFLYNMGVCLSLCSQDKKDDSEYRKSRSIDKQIKSDEKKMKSEIKMLLLGKEQDTNGIRVDPSE